MPERKVNLEREVFFLIFSEKNQKKHLPLYELLLLLPENEFGQKKCIVT